MSPPSREENKPFITINKEHWEQNWEAGVSERPLSRLNVFNRDATNFLEKKLRGSTQAPVVEIGFAPGKFLQHLEHRFKATCHGFDYSDTGCRKARHFLGSLNSKVQVHCQDVLLAPPSITHQARLVYSIGVVEHFADPTGMIRAHLEPMADDGVTVILLPNYSGVNRRIQGWLDPENLAIHNLDSMTPEFWEQHALKFPGHEFKTYRWGRLNPWMFSLQKFGKAGLALQFALNFMSFLLPPYASAWASMFVIEIRKR